MMKNKSKNNIMIRDEKRVKKWKELKKENKEEKKKKKKWWDSKK